MRIGKARKSLAIFSDLMLKKVTKVRRLKIKLCHPHDITIDLNPHYLSKKNLSSVYYASKILSKIARSNLEVRATHLTKSKANFLTPPLQLASKEKDRRFYSR